MSKALSWLIASPLLFATLSSLLMASPEERQRYDLAYASVAALKAKLPNPGGIAFDAVRVTDAGAACIHFHSRGDTGRPGGAQAVVADGAIARSDAHDGGFEKQWERRCLGQSYDVTEAVVRFF